MIQYGVVAHVGVGSPETFTDGCRAACESAWRLLESGAPALEAVVEAACILENDGRFNAGSGSVLRLDGKTREMDAGVMDSGNNLGIVISLRDVKNPVLVARAVVETPHVALSGQGAMAFARRRGYEYLPPVSQSVLERYERMKRFIKQGNVGIENPQWQGHDPESLWNFEEVSYRDIFSCDTIGVVALDREGASAVAVSTGGASPMMLGRVGDSPMIGCGFYAGSAGAVCATGVGEEIIKRMLSKAVYDRVEQGEDLKIACGREVGRFPHRFPAGVIALSRSAYAVAANRELAYYALIKE